MDKWEDPYKDELEFLNLSWKGELLAITLFAIGVGGIAFWIMSVL